MATFLTITAHVNTDPGHLAVGTTGESSGKATSSRNASGLRSQSLGSVPSGDDDDKVRSSCVMRRAGNEAPSAAPRIALAPCDDQPSSRSSLGSRGSAAAATTCRLSSVRRRYDARPTPQCVPSLHTAYYDPWVPMCRVGCINFAMRRLLVPSVAHASCCCHVCAGSS